MHSPCIEKTDWRAAEMYKQHKRLGDSNEIRNHNYLVCDCGFECRAVT